MEKLGVRGSKNNDYVLLWDSTHQFLATCWKVSLWHHFDLRTPVFVSLGHHYDLQHKRGLHRITIWQQLLLPSKTSDSCHFGIWSYYISNPDPIPQMERLASIDDANHVSNAGDGIDPRNRAWSQRGQEMVTNSWFWISASRIYESRTNCVPCFISGAETTIDPVF